MIDPKLLSVSSNNSLTDEEETQNKPTHISSLDSIL